MLIDVQDPGLNVILNASFYGLAATAIASILPWPIRGGRNRWTLWLPLAAIALYVAYELAMPTRMNIRVDLLLIWPFLLIVLIAWLIRLIVLRRAH